MKTAFLKRPGFIPILSVFIIFSALYFVSSLPVVFKDTFHHYVYLADAFSRGKLNLKLPSHTEHEIRDSFDDIAFYNNRFYLGLPPAPALILLPFIPWSGVHTNARLITVFWGAASACLCYLLLGAERNDENKRRWLTALFSGGTVLWFVSSHGGAWYMAQTCAVFFMLASLLFAYRGKAIISGLFLAGAFLSRQLTILALPAILTIIHENSGSRKNRAIFQTILGPSLGVFLYLVYNQLRFGNILETGYAHHLITGEAVIQFQRYGLFHFHYLPRNLYTLLLMPPLFMNQFPYIFPRLEGMALTFTSPALVYVFRSGIKNPITRSLWLSVILILGGQLFYCNNGAWQFGYRFILDALPLIILLVARGMGYPLSKTAKGLIILSILINLYGVIMLRHLL